MFFLGKNRKRSSIKYRCNLCGFAYKTIWWMKQHMKMKHPTESADDFSETTQGINYWSTYFGTGITRTSVCQMEKVIYLFFTFTSSYFNVGLPVMLVLYFKFKINFYAGLDIESPFSTEISSPISVASNKNHNIQVIWTFAVYLRL